MVPVPGTCSKVRSMDSKSPQAARRDGLKVPGTLVVLQRQYALFGAASR